MNRIIICFRSNASHLWDTRHLSQIYKCALLTQWMKNRPSKVTLVQRILGWPVIGWKVETNVYCGGGSERVVPPSYIASGPARRGQSRAAPRYNLYCNGIEHTASAPLFLFPLWCNFAESACHIASVVNGGCLREARPALTPRQPPRRVHCPRLLYLTTHVPNSQRTKNFQESSPQKLCL